MNQNEAKWKLDLREDRSVVTPFYRSNINTQKKDKLVELSGEIKRRNRFKKSLDKVKTIRAL